MEHLQKCRLTEPQSQAINKIEKKCLSGKWFSELIIQWPVINRDKIRFTALAFNMSNSREIMQNLDGRFFMAMTISQELPHFPDSLLPLELH